MYCSPWSFFVKPSWNSLSTLVPVLALVASVGVVLAVPVGAQQPPSGSSKILPPPGPDRGSEAEFEWTTIEGETLTPETLSGQVVLLDFWASWCVPCQRAIPHLKSLDRELPDELFEIVGINLDDDKTKLHGWVATYGPTWSQVWDPSKEVAKSFRIGNVPAYIVLDHEGRVTYSTSGWSSTTGRLLDYRLQQAVQRARQAGAAVGE